MNLNTSFEIKSLKSICLSLCLVLISINSFAFENCPAPTNFVVSIQANSATLTWDPAPGAISYEVGYFNQNDGSTATAQTGGTIYIFNNLPLGVYQFWVRSLCEDGSWSAFIIEMEEIDGALMEDIYNCLCDTFYDLEVESAEHKIELNWNVEDQPCFTQYEFSTSMTTFDGEERSSHFRFTYDPGEIEELVNGCVEENVPLVVTPDDGPTRTYIQRDEQGAEMFSMEFKEESFSINYSQENVESYTFDFSNCVFCPDEDGSAETSSEPEEPESIEVEQEVRVWPNPFSEEVKIEWFQSSDYSTTVEVYNASGIIISNVTKGNASDNGENYLRLNTNDWPLGVYFIIVDTGDQRFESKLVKLK